MTQYVGVLDGGGKAFGVRIPDLPGCYGGGASAEAAIADAMSAAREWLGHREKKGESKTCGTCHLDHRIASTTSDRAGGIAGPVSGLKPYRPTPASCLCIEAASVASLAAALDSRTKLSQCTAACAIFVPRYVFAIAACSVASAVYRFANVRKYSSRLW